MLFKIEDYRFNVKDLRVENDEFVLPVEPVGYRELNLRQYIKKSIALLLEARVEKAAGGLPPGIKPEHEAKAKAKYPPGTRWITIHPQNREKGVPVLVRDHGDGTAHIIGGAGGKLNLMKLSNIKSPEEYKRKVRARKEAERAKKKAEKEEEKKYIETFSKEERKKYVETKKQQKQEQLEKELERKRKTVETEQEFVDSITDSMGWEQYPIEEFYEEQREQLERQLADAIAVEDEAAEKQIRKDMGLLKKANKRALKSQRKNVIAQAKEIVRKFQQDMLSDTELREDIEKQIEQPSQSEEIIRTELGEKGKGFRAGYRESAEEKGKLTEEELSKEKQEEFEKRLGEIAEEISPSTANMIRKGVETNRAINEVKKGIYGEKEEYPTKVAELDSKVEMLRKYLEMKKKLKETEEEAGDIKEVQKTLDGSTVEEVPGRVNEIKYGNGVKLDWNITSEDLAESLMEEQERITAQRQAALNGSFLETIQKNPGGAEKWIANGNFNGFNSTSLATLKYEGLDRDTVDLLGVGNSAKLLASLIRQHSAPEEYEDIAKGMEKYHEEINETIVVDALEKGQELLNRAESIQLDIANNPNDLTLINDLNEARLQYLDESNRIMGQALGSLEASAAMVVELQRKEEALSIDTNLGKISNEEAIVRMRALGLGKEEYEISTIDRNKIIRINESGVEKLANKVDREEVSLQNEVEAIKAGAEDEPDWLPDGIISRPEETFEDPGPDAAKPKGHIDNQEIPQGKKTMESLHRSLGALPEGSFAFKNAEDLSSKEMTDLRRYWETNLYRGSMAEAMAERKYLQGKAKTKQGLWNGFVKENGGSQEAAFEAIRQDLINNHSTEDMFGTKEIPPVAQVQAGNLESYRKVPEAAGLFSEIENLESDLAQGLVTSEARARQEIEKKRKELPEKVQELYENAMKNHFIKYISGATEAELEAGERRLEKTAWGEYVRMHGSIERAQEAVLDRIKGNFLKQYVKHHGQVHGVPLQTEKKKIRNYQDHVLGMLGKEERDSIINKVQAELASAGATVARRERGKFARGAWKEAALKEIERRQQEAAKQIMMFGEEELKQEDNTEMLTIGKRAEEQLKQLLPHAAANQRRRQRYHVFANLTMSSDKHIQQQRAVKMFEKTKRMNLTFGTGKGKTLTSVGAFTHLKAKDKAKRAIFAVPSVVQAQFGEEMLKVTEPSKYRWSANPGMTRAKRIQALKDGKLDMVVFTHQSLRDDLVHLMSKHIGKTEEQTKEHFNSRPESERKSLLKEVLDKEAINADMLVIDESHYMVKRKGKVDSTLSNIMDALNQNVEYFMNQSATPVKNDASEAYDMLKKMDPARFADRQEFFKRYGVDTSFTRESLRRLISRYNYASPTVTGVRRNERKEAIALSAEQNKAYKEVEEAFTRSSRATREGKVDAEAMKLLSPNSFKGVRAERHPEIARRLQASVGVIKEEAFNRVVNQYPWETNAKAQKIMDILAEKYYPEDHPQSGAKAGDMQPGVIFAHNIESINQLQRALQSQGARVGILQGSMNGNEKDTVKTAFNPPDPRERKYDVLLCSDAGATGLNLQNAKYLINYDLPHTSWVREQRMGRIDRHGQLHDEIDYHDLVTDTEHERVKWNRIQRKAELGSIFQADPGTLDDSGLAAFIEAVKQDRYNHGIERVA